MKYVGDKHLVNYDGSINYSFERLMQRDFILAAAINMKGCHGRDSPPH